MRRDDDSTGLLRATFAGLALFVVSTGMLAVADEALDVTAVAGGIGVVISGALLGLVVLVARWRVAGAAYTATAMDDARGDVVAEAFDDPATAASSLDDAAVV